eukprot:PhF_6_TR27148/c0_g1_i1/m.39651
MIFKSIFLVICAVQLSMAQFRPNAMCSSANGTLQTIQLAVGVSTTLISDTDGFGPTKYTDYQSCAWNLVCPEGTTFAVQSLNYDTESCCDSVVISNANNRAQLGAYAGTMGSVAYQAFPVNNVTVAFRTDSSIEGRGFTLISTCVRADQPCSEIGAQEQCQETYNCSWNTASSSCTAGCRSFDEQSCEANPQCAWKKHALRCDQPCSTINDVRSCNADAECSWNSRKSRCEANCYEQTTTSHCARENCTWDGLGRCRPSCRNFEDQYSCQYLATSICSWNGRSCVDACTTENHNSCALRADCYWDSYAPLCKASCQNLNASLCRVNPNCTYSASSGCHTACSSYNNLNSCSSNQNCSWVKSIFWGSECADSCSSKKTPSECTTFCGWDYTRNICAQTCTLLSSTSCIATPECSWFPARNRCYKRCELETQSNCLFSSVCQVTDNATCSTRCELVSSENICTTTSGCHWNGNMCQSVCDNVNRTLCSTRGNCTWTQTSGCKTICSARVSAEECASDSTCSWSSSGCNTACGSYTTKNTCHSASSHCHWNSTLVICEEGARACRSPNTTAVLLGATDVINYLVSDDDGIGSEPYTSLENCSWTISCPLTSRVVLSGDYDLETCCDSLSVLDSVNGTSLDKFSGRNSLYHEYDTHAVIIRFKSDFSVENRGFTLGYSCTTPDDECSLLSAEWLCSQSSMCSFNQTTQTCQRTCSTFFDYESCLNTERCFYNFDRQTCYNESAESAQHPTCETQWFSTSCVQNASCVWNETSALCYTSCSELTSSYQCENLDLQGRCGWSPTLSRCLNQWTQRDCASYSIDMNACSQAEECEFTPDFGCVTRCAYTTVCPPDRCFWDSFHQQCTAVSVTLPPQQPGCGSLNQTSNIMINEGQVYTIISDTDGDGPIEYSNGDDCMWNVACSNSSAKLVIVRVSYSTEGCCDYITIDNDTRFSGAAIRDLQPLSTSNAVIRWTSDGSVVSSGFTLSLTCLVPTPCPQITSASRCNAEFNCSWYSETNTCGKSCEAFTEEECHATVSCSWKKSQNKCRLACQKKGVDAQHCFSDPTCTYSPETGLCTENCQEISSLSHCSRENCTVKRGVCSVPCSRYSRDVGSCLYETTDCMWSNNQCMDSCDVQKSPWSCQQLPNCIYNTVSQTCSINCGSMSNISLCENTQNCTWTGSQCQASCDTFTASNQCGNTQHCFWSSSTNSCAPRCDTFRDMYSCRENQCQWNYNNNSCQMNCRMLSSTDCSRYGECLLLPQGICYNNPCSSLNTSVCGNTSVCRRIGSSGCGVLCRYMGSPDQCFMRPDCYITGGRCATRCFALTTDSQCRMEPNCTWDTWTNRCGQLNPPTPAPPTPAPTTPTPAVPCYMLTSNSSCSIQRNQCNWDALQSRCIPRCLFGLTECNSNYPSCYWNWMTYQCSVNYTAVPQPACEVISSMTQCLAYRTCEWLPASQRCQLKRVVTCDAVVNCNGHGTVSLINGTCVCTCRNQWMGSTCNTCDGTRFSGQDCDQCAAGLIQYPSCRASQTNMSQITSQCRSRCLETQCSSYEVAVDGVTEPRCICHNCTAPGGQSCTVTSPKFFCSYPTTSCMSISGQKKCVVSITVGSNMEHLIVDCTTSNCPASSSGGGASGRGTSLSVPSQYLNVPLGNHGKGDEGHEEGATSSAYSHWVVAGAMCMGLISLVVVVIRIKKRTSESEFGSEGLVS